MPWKRYKKYWPWIVLEVINNRNDPAATIQKWKSSFHPQFGEIRCVNLDSTPYFEGKDVADVLGYKDTAKAIRVHVDEEGKGDVKMTTPGGLQQRQPSSTSPASTHSSSPPNYPSLASANDGSHPRCPSDTQNGYLLGNDKNYILSTRLLWCTEERNNIGVYGSTEIRSVNLDSTPYFEGKDVAEVLHYTNTAKAIRDHVEAEDKLTERIVLSGQSREVSGWANRRMKHPVALFAGH